MSALYAGLLCTLLLIGAIAALFGCMSAARCLRRSSFALCLAITGLDFAPLAALLSRLPACDALSPAPWTAATITFAGAEIVRSGKNCLKRKRWKTTAH